MHVLILASHPFRGLRGRQQQMAAGLAAAGHRVLYVEPFLSDEGKPAGGRRAKAGAPAEAGSPGFAVRAEGERIHVLGPEAAPESGPGPRTGSASGPELVPTAPASRSELQSWARQVRSLIEELTQGDLFRSPASPGPSAGTQVREGAAGAKALGSEAVPDIAIVYSPVLLEAASGALPAPIVFDCEEDFPATASSRSVADAYEQALNRGLPLVDGLVAVNRYLIESWGLLLRPEVPRAVIEHGADLKLFRPPDEKSRKSARKALGLSADAKVAAYVGRLDARVSYEDLSFMFDQESALKLLVLGEVNDEGQAMLERLPQERVIVRGPLPQEQAAELIAAADLILLPLRREPHLEPLRGLTLYEYLATGLPVVGTFRRGTKAFRELLYLYATQEELAAALLSALAEGVDAPVRGERIAKARGADWATRVHAMEEFLGQVIRRRG